jgi:hypothetical protein
MISHRSFRRLPWEDRFTRPTISALRLGMKEQIARVFDAAHREFCRMSQNRFEVVWRGECWRWTIAYTSPADSRLLAVLVPNPLDLQVAAPLDGEFVRSLSNVKMKRAVRDGVELAADPFDTDWGVWSVASKDTLGEIVRLIERRIRFDAHEAPNRGK